MGEGTTTKAGERIVGMIRKHLFKCVFFTFGDGLLLNHSVVRFSNSNVVSCYDTLHLVIIISPDRKMRLITAACARVLACDTNFSYLLF